MMKLMEVKCKVTPTNRDKRQYAERHFLFGNKQLYMAVGGSFVLTRNAKLMCTQRTFSNKVIVFHFSEIECESSHDYIGLLVKDLITT